MEAELIRNYFRACQPSMLLSYALSSKISRCCGVVIVKVVFAEAIEKLCMLIYGEWNLCNSGGLSWIGRNGIDQHHMSVCNSFCLVLHVAG